MPRQAKRTVANENPQAKRNVLTDDAPLDSVLLVADYPYMTVEVGPRPAGPLSAHPSVQFVLTDFDYRRERYIGTLVLTKENWESWFKGVELYPQYAGSWLDAAQAIAQLDGVQYGCATCPSFFTKDFDEMQAHVRKHGGR